MAVWTFTFIIIQERDIHIQDTGVQFVYFWLSVSFHHPLYTNFFELLNWSFTDFYHWRKADASFLCFIAIVNYMKKAWENHKVGGSIFILALPLLDNGQTKPKPRVSKKGEAKKTHEALGESRCLFRATNGKRKLSTVVRSNAFKPTRLLKEI